jgi:hypothetical protein
MNAQLNRCSDLRPWLPEDRPVPVVPSQGLGTTVLTTGGYVPTSALPGAAIPAFEKRNHSLTYGKIFRCCNFVRLT